MFKKCQIPALFRIRLSSHTISMLRESHPHGFVIWYFFGTSTYVKWSLLDSFKWLRFLKEYFAAKIGKKLKEQMG
jgi:hypothetical protein